MSFVVNATTTTTTTTTTEFLLMFWLLFEFIFLLTVNLSVLSHYVHSFL